MPGIPVYSSSPINAAKASGATPQTARPEEKTGVDAPSTATPADSQPGYTAPQPAARPPAPVQTGAPQPASNLAPTPTQTLQDAGPPPPQPGAVPVPPPGTSHLPPPPKAGEKLQHPPMPPQMSYPAPNSGLPTGASSATSVPPPSLVGGPQPTSLQEVGAGNNYSHPPGYRQDVHASEFNNAPRLAHNESVAQNSGMFDNAGDDDGVWGAAKKWASAAGNSLAAAENEVWKRINKD